MTEKPKIFSRLIISCHILFAVCFMLAGCATAPVKESLPVYSLNGSSYYPLSALCQSRGISLNYDIYTRTANLIKDNHTIDLMVGDNLVLLDKRALLLKHPVDMHHGMVIVPLQFKELALDPIFKVAGVPVITRKAPLSLFVKKVVVDPGHGGRDPGAVGRTGLKEKDVNLDIAKRLAKRLKQEGVEVVMTRNTDVFIPLGKRVELANNSRADLFISIHANANKTRSGHGLEVYYVSPTVNDSTRALYAAKYSHLNLDNSFFSGDSQTLRAILWDMIYTYNRAESIVLGREICRAAGDSLDIRVIGVKDARFEVLRGARIPAILVEVGFLSNAKEEQLLKDGYYRDKLSQSILEGVFNYAKNCN
jgi:N-acetylmuramoyl-L-alanine amidase